MTKDIISKDCIDFSLVLGAKKTPLGFGNEAALIWNFGIFLGWSDH